MQSGQRGAKEHPGAASRARGRRLRWPQRLAAIGFEGGDGGEQAAGVGMRGVLEELATAPISTIFPAYMTATRSLTRPTTARSCETKSMASEASAQVGEQRQNLRLTVTSSAVVGSSAMSRAGRLTMAMAIMTRWRWPPES